MQVTQRKKKPPGNPAEMFEWWAGYPGRIKPKMLSRAIQRFSEDPSNSNFDRLKRQLSVIGMKTPATRRTNRSKLVLKFLKDLNNWCDAYTELKYKNIPKIIHFIWVGGTLPEDYLKNLAGIYFNATESGFEVNLWLDNIEDYKKTADKSFELRQLKLRTVKDLLQNAKTDPFYTSSEAVRRGSLNRFKYWMNMERIGLKNLAAVADFLRYEILRQEGGYYIDIDSRLATHVKNKGQSMSLADLVKMKPNLAKHGFMFNAIPDFERDPQSKEINFRGWRALANDMLAATPHHPISENAINMCVDAYDRMSTELQSNESFRGHTKMQRKRLPVASHGKGSKSSDRSVLTKEASGPTLLFHAWEKFCEDENVSVADMAFKFSFPLNSRTKMTQKTIVDVAGLPLNMGVGHATSWLASREQISYDDIELKERGVTKKGQY